MDPEAIVRVGRKLKVENLLTEQMVAMNNI
jgi:hypothetical protein